MNCDLLSAITLLATQRDAVELIAVKRALILLQFPLIAHVQNNPLARRQLEHASLIVGSRRPFFDYSKMSHVMLTRGGGSGKNFPSAIWKYSP